MNALKASIVDCWFSCNWWLAIDIWKKNLKYRDKYHSFCAIDCLFFITEHFDDEAVDFHYNTGMMKQWWIDFSYLLPYTMKATIIRREESVLLSDAVVVVVVVVVVAPVCRMTHVAAGITLNLCPSFVCKGRDCTWRLHVYMCVHERYIYIYITRRKS